MLCEFIVVHREEIIRRCRTKVANRSVPAATMAAIDRGVPLFLNQLGDALRRGVSSTELRRRAALHGHDLLLQGLTVSQVVQDYGNICQSIAELAIETDAPVPAEDFRLLNGCLDDAIAGALTEFGRELNQSTIDTYVLREQERLGIFTHELRNFLGTATLAFQAVKSGNVGVGGSTGAVLERSLQGASALVVRSLGEINMSRGDVNRQVLLMADLIDELTPSAMLMAQASHATLVVGPVADDIAIEADPQVLSSVLTNVIQNACKFTRAGTEVTLRVLATDDRVLMEIQDECGGMSAENPDTLFSPFEQRGADRTGLGLGLTFCRRAVEANNGRISVRDLPGTGCVFTVDLPRVHASVTPLSA